MTRRVRPRAHQHARPEPGHDVRQFGGPPGTGPAAARGSELERRRRHGALLAQFSSSAGNTAENRVDARGSAIISATASRQAA
jgi:hypothetical protein